MFQTIISRIGWFISLVLLQALVFNHVHIFGYATPMPYVYFLLILPSDTPRWLYVVLGFALGLCIDILTTTPGIAAGATCLLGLLAPLYLRIFRRPTTTMPLFPPSALWNGIVSQNTFFECPNLLHRFLPTRSFLFLRLANFTHQYSG